MDAPLGATRADHGSDGDECGFSSFTPPSEVWCWFVPFVGDGVSSKTLSAALLFSHSGSHVSAFAPLKYGAESEAVFAITPDLRCYFDVLADALSVSHRVVHRLVRLWFVDVKTAEVSLPLCFPLSTFSPHDSALSLTYCVSISILISLRLSYLFFLVPLLSIPDPPPSLSPRAHAHAQKLIEFA